MQKRKILLTWALDLLCLFAIVLAAVWIWPTWELPLPAAGPEAPGWGTVRDGLLDGPDSGEWAANILALREGRFDALDPHRMPTWQLLVSLVLFVEPDVARAGHLTNHLLHLVLGLGVYLLGRMGGNRAVGLAAAMLALTATHAVDASLRFGVDAAVLALVPVTLLAALLALVRWPLALLCGLVCGLVSATHFSTLPYALPAMAVLLFCGARGRRIRLLLLHLLGVGLMVWALSRVFPVATFEDLQVSIANGIAPGYQGDGRVSSWGSASSILQEGASGALDRAMAGLLNQVRPGWLPWNLALVLVPLGVLGLGLKKGGGSRESGGWKLELWDRCDLGLGVGLLLCLAPLPVFAMAQAPERYAANLAPLGALLLVRGLFGLAWLVVWSLGRVSAAAHRLHVPVQVLLAVAVFVGAMRDVLPTEPLRPSVVELGRWQLGQILKEEFEAGSGVSSTIREVLVAGGLRRCPRYICPEEATRASYIKCLDLLSGDCDGEGPVGYVVTDADLDDPNSPARGDMDAWLAEQWSPARTLVLPGFSAEVYAISRDEIADLLLLESSENGLNLGVIGPPMDGLVGSPRPGEGEEVPLGPDGAPLPGFAPPPLGPDGLPLSGDFRPPPGSSRPRPAPR